VVFSKSTTSSSTSRIDSNLSLNVVNRHESTACFIVCDHPLFVVCCLLYNQLYGKLYLTDLARCYAVDNPATFRVRVWRRSIIPTRRRFLYRAALNAGGPVRTKLSVCLSVRLSVYLPKSMHCHKTEERFVQIFIPYERSLSLVFWEEKW